MQIGLGYDDAGRIKRLFDPANPSTDKLRYDYDGIDRLTVTRDGMSNNAIETYGYDATGNRKSFTYNEANMQPVTQRLPERQPPPVERRGRRAQLRQRRQHDDDERPGCGMINEERRFKLLFVPTIPF